MTDFTPSKIDGTKPVGKAEADSYVGVDGFPAREGTVRLYCGNCDSDNLFLRYFDGLLKAYCHRCGKLIATYKVRDDTCSPSS